MFKPTKTTSR